MRTHQKFHSDVFFCLPRYAEIPDELLFSAIVCEAQGYLPHLADFKLKPAHDDDVLLQDV